MDARITDLQKRSNQLFSKRECVLSLWQEIAELTYPERADFLGSSPFGRDFGAHLTTSFPLIARRDLGNGMGSLLRQESREWFKTTTNRDDRQDHEAKQWLEWSGNVQRRAMYDPITNFRRACKEGDHDYIAFGQCAISIEFNANRNAMLYRNWHLRDMAWAENSEQKVDVIYHKMKVQARELTRLYPKTCGEKIRKINEKDPFQEVEVCRAVMPADMWEKKVSQPYVSIRWSVEGDCILEEVGSWTTAYAIPRWQTLSGSPYGLSPAMVAGIPDVRLLQAMARTLLDAGEMTVRPPMLAVHDAIRSDYNLFAGGITRIQAEYDERLGEVLRPLSIDSRGIPLGLEMAQDVRQMIIKAFYLDKLRPPLLDKQMTAYEYSKLIDGWIIDAAPLFEPTETEYNGQLCDQTFEIMLRNGAFGRNIPRSLQGEDVTFVFSSPLKDAVEKQSAGKLMEARQLLAAVADVDPASAFVVDWKGLFRKAAEAIVPMQTIRSEQDVEGMARMQAEQAQQQQQLAAIQQGSEAVRNMGGVASEGV